MASIRPLQSTLNTSAPPASSTPTVLISTRNAGLVRSGVPCGPASRQLVINAGLSRGKHCSRGWQAKKDRNRKGRSR